MQQSAHSTLWQVRARRGINDYRCIPDLHSKRGQSVGTSDASIPSCLEGVSTPSCPTGKVLPSTNPNIAVTITGESTMYMHIAILDKDPGT